MRKVISIVLLINFYHACFAQVIEGMILDRNTELPISFASVYFNGSYTGAHSDKNGHFELDISDHPIMPLTISSLGYYSTTFNDFSTDKIHRIYLVPKIFELNEVIISARAYARERRANLKIFKNEFLGKTVNSLSCEIVNEDDIILTYDSDNDTLKAFCSNPILVENKALGYSVTYFMDKFVYRKSENYMVLVGNISFRDALQVNNDQKLRYERRRKTAYLGSRMHFFRSLWNDNLDFEGFTLIDSDHVPVSIDTLVTGDQTRYLKYQGNIYITYYSKLAGSIMVLTKDSVQFGKNGYFDGTGISWYGEMIQQRVGDWLPYEYSIK